MRRIQPISKQPAAAQNIAIEVKIAFIIDVLTAATPLVQGKDPQNPEDTGSNPET